MEFGQLMTDILVNVSCKFEMYIFKIAQVINENVCIAFLYVLSIPIIVFLISFLFVSFETTIIKENLHKSFFESHKI